MADGDIVFDEVGDCGVAVDDGVVLNVDAPADDDGGDVAADDGAEPDAGVFADGDVADDGAVFGAEKAGLNAEEANHGGNLIDSGIWLELNGIKKHGLVLDRAKPC